MAGGLFKEFAAMNYATALGVGCGIYNAPDAGKADGACALGAGFKRDVKVKTGDTLRPGKAAGLTDYEDFGMGGGIVEFARAVTVAGDDQA